MKKYFLAIIPISIIIIFLVLTTEYTYTIVGKWRSVEASNEYYYTFNEDKTCSYEMIVARLGCTYEIEDDKLKILYKGNDEAKTFYYQIEGNNLIIKDESGKDNRFVRVD